MSNEQDQQNQAPKRKKSNRAAGNAPSGDGQTPAASPERKTTRDGKPIRNTASGFTVVG